MEVFKQGERNYIICAVVNKLYWKKKDGSSDGRAGTLRLKGASFNPYLDPMRRASKYDSY